VTSARNTTENAIARRELRTAVASESLGFLTAELASIFTGLGVVALADKVIPKEVFEPASKFLGKHIVEPILDPIDKVVSSVCKLEECKSDPSLSREERAKRIGHGMIVFGAAYAISMGVKLSMRPFLRDKFDPDIKPLSLKLDKNAPTWDKVKHWAKGNTLSTHERMITVADEGVHYGALFLLNSPMAGVTDDLIRSTTKMIHKTTGLSDEKSNEVAKMIWVWDASNVLGAMAGIGVIAGSHYKQWPKGMFAKALENKYETKTFAEKVAKGAEQIISHGI
jgi:hypothetical protein